MARVYSAIALLPLISSLNFAKAQSVQKGVSQSQRSEPFLLSVEGALAIAVSEPQSRWYGAGATVGVGVYRSMSSWALLGLRLRGLMLANGDAPDPVRYAGYKDPGVGSAGSLTLALRLRPFSSKVHRRTLGFWFETAGGPTITGGRARVGLELGAGYGFAVNKQTAVSPVLRYTQIIQPSDALESNDARILLLGLELSFFDRLRSPAQKEKTIAKVAEVPKSDRDGDGFLDHDDACPADPEDFDKFEDRDGCPEPDNDRDGIPDDKDKCPMEPEDTDGFEDEDGCPEYDNDQDGVPDSVDQCPDLKEVINGVDDQDGCPDTGLIEFVRDRVILSDTVLFEFEKARVRNKAKPLLAAIVRLWLQHPEWEMMRVEGHTDHRGSAMLNQNLSEKRAANVVSVLVQLGLPKERVEYAGLGSSKPRDTRPIEAAYERNRRVEFIVTQKKKKELLKEPETKDKSSEVQKRPVQNMGAKK